MALHQSEWLHEAKAIAIGRQARVYHGSESRPNLVVHNNHDSWSCYCHACHEGGFVIKELVKLSPEPVVTTPRGVPRGQEITIENAPIALIVDYAHKSGVSIQDLKDWGFRYDPLLRRLMYQSPLGSPYVVMGRALIKSKMKWYRYTGTGEYINLGNMDASVVYLTEDILSAHKLYDTLYYMAHNALHSENFAVVCCLGTTMSNALTVALLKAKSVVIALDGDDAGRHATADFKRKLQLYSIPNFVLEVDEGKDPKHLTRDSLIERILNVRRL